MADMVGGGVGGSREDGCVFGLLAAASDAHAIQPTTVVLAPFMALWRRRQRRQQPPLDVCTRARKAFSRSIYWHELAFISTGFRLQTFLEEFRTPGTYSVAE